MVGLEGDLVVEESWMWRASSLHGVMERINKERAVHTDAERDSSCRGAGVCGGKCSPMHDMLSSLQLWRWPLLSRVDSFDLLVFHGVPW